MNINGPGVSVVPVRAAVNLGKSNTACYNLSATYLRSYHTACKVENRSQYHCNSNNMTDQCWSIPLDLYSLDTDRSCDDAPSPDLEWDLQLLYYDLGRIALISCSHPSPAVTGLLSWMLAAGCWLSVSLRSRYLCRLVCSFVYA
ncbi:hypothetical protein ILYODFUR_015027 [Ilyodon furcidens]|uniref:Uncharacterized protein n=1 Tax=Ilyodon furcidens TaxID=33524 RepID=A0ABV0V5T8_9TELE